MTQYNDYKGNLHINSQREKTSGVNRLLKMFLDLKRESGIVILFTRCLQKP